VFATGYDMSIPYVPDDYVDWKSHRPDLYLNVFSRRKDDLFGVSYIEVNSSAYTLFDHIANLIAQYLVDERDRPQAAERFRKLVQHDRPNLSGGIHFVATDRHATYVEVRAFRKQLRRIARLLGWSTLAPGMFDRLRRSTGAARDAA